MGLYGVLDRANGILMRDIFGSLDEAKKNADWRNSIPPSIRRLPRRRPEYVPVEVEEDGLEEMLVGFRKAFKVKEGGENEWRS